MAWVQLLDEWSLPHEHIVKLPQLNPDACRLVAVAIMRMRTTDESRCDVILLAHTGDDEIAWMNHARQSS